MKKLKDKLNLKNEKVLLGLFALLFASTFLTSTIILDGKKVAKSDSKNQSAQVGSIKGSDKELLDEKTLQTCLNVSHLYNFQKPFFVDQVTPPDAEYSGEDFYSVSLEFHFNVTNTCNYDIAVTNPTGIHSTRAIDVPDDVLIPTRLNSFSYSDLEILYNEEPQTSDILNDSFITSDFESLVVLTGNGGLTNFSYYPGTVTPTPINGAVLTVGQTKPMSLYYRVIVPKNTPFAFRISPKRIGWFKLSTAADGLTEGEIRSHLFSPVQSNLYASDFIRTYVMPGYEGMIDDGSAEFKSYSEEFKKSMEEVNNQILELNKDLIKKNTNLKR